MAGATRVPSSSIARISFVCGKAATLIWNVSREMPPYQRLVHAQNLFGDGFRIADNERSAGSEQSVVVRAGDWWPATFLADLRNALRITRKEVGCRPSPRCRPRSLRCISDLVEVRVVCSAIRAPQGWRDRREFL